MAVPTYLEIADNIKSRIGEITSGKMQSYSFAGRTFTYLNLKELADLEQYFRGLAAEEANKFGCVTFASMRSVNY